MNVKNILFGGLLVAALGFVAVGCNENPTDTTTGTAPGKVNNVSAVSLSETTVGLKWDAPTSDGVTGAITYRVAWQLAGNTSSTDSGSVEGLSATQATVTVTAQKAYTFWVFAIRGGKASNEATITWAGATRYGTTTTLRMYEDESSSPSGLTIDPALGGPKPASVSATVNPNLGNVQLAMFTDASDPTNFRIGAAFGFLPTEYQNVDQFNQTTYMSDSSWNTPNLDGLYLTKSLDTWFTNPNGYKATFVLPIAQTNNGQVFYVRTGSATTGHYARVLVKNNGGKMLQGSAPNRYVELEISYQNGAGVPYAKTAPHAYTPANIGAQVRR